MKQQREEEPCLRSIHLNVEDLLQQGIGIKVKFLLPSMKMHGIQKSDESEKMVTMQMTDKDMLYPLDRQVVSPQLELGPFATVDQKEALICIEQMSA
jgi:hypothetical protein